MKPAAFLALGLALLSCEVMFDPIVPSDTVFSMSGYLDASADTQWVRVEAFARTTGVDPGPLAAEVGLEDLVEGGTVPLAQQVRTFATGPAHLFWTTAPVALGGRYRLRARRADGAEATAEAEIPGRDDFEVTVESGPFICPTRVTVSGAERVVDIQARYRVRHQGRTVEYRLTHIDTAARPAAGTVRTSIYPDDDFRALGVPAGAEVLRSEVLVGVSTEAWPDVVGVTLEDALRLDSAIANGVGFLGGAVTRRLPFVRGAGTGVFGQSEPCVAP